MILNIYTLAMSNEEKKNYVKDFIELAFSKPDYDYHLAFQMNRDIIFCFVD
jgi:hypothetical protein